MKHVPALGVLAIAGQLVEAGAAPDVGRHTPVFLQQLLGRDRLAQNGARAQQLDTRREFRPFLAQVHALDDLLFGPLSEAGHGVVFVEQREVVEDVVLLLHHALEAVVQDHTHFVSKGGVVAHTVRDRVGQNVAVAVFVLQAFAVERGAPRGAAEEEAARLHIARRPGQITNALETKHRVIHVERDHDPVAGAVARGRRDPAAHAARFVDPFLQDLTSLVLLVVHHLVFIDRRVLLSGRVVDSDLTEQTLHAERTGLVNQNGHDAGTDFLLTQQLGQKAHIGLGCGDLATFGGGLDHGFEGLQRRHREAFVSLDTAVWQVATQRLAPLVQVTHLRSVIGRFVKRQLGQLAVRDRDVEAVAEEADVFIAEFLGLVNGVLALAHFAHAKALDGLDQQHRWLTGGLHRSIKSRINLLGIMAAATQIANFLIGHVGHHLQRSRIATEEMLAHVSAVIGFECLVIAVVALHHDLAQRTIFVGGQQRIPLAAPDQLDHVPARSTELTLKLLNDLAIAPHRAIQALKVAIDHENQVVEFFPRGKADRPQRLHLIHFAVTAEHPDLAVLGVGNATGVQVLEEASLVDGHQRAQAHRHGGELPEVGHQLRVGITGQALAIHFLAEVQQLLFSQAALHIGPRIDTWRDVTLNEQAIPAMVLVLGMPEMVETGTKEAGQRGKRTDVATQIAPIGGIGSVGLDYHGHGIPAHIGTKALLDLKIAGRARLLGWLDGVHITGVCRKRQIHAVLASLFQQLLQQVVGPLGSFALNDGY